MNNYNQSGLAGLNGVLLELFTGWVGLNDCAQRLAFIHLLLTILALVNDEDESTNVGLPSANVELPLTNDEDELFDHELFLFLWTWLIFYKYVYFITNAINSDANIIYIIY